MLQLAASMQGRPFRMVAVSQDDDDAALRAFAAEFGMDPALVLILRDPEGAVARRFGTELLPETYMIDPDGVIVARFANERDWTGGDFRGVIERMAQRRWRAR